MHGHFPSFDVKVKVPKISVLRSYEQHFCSGLATHGAVARVQPAGDGSDRCETSSLHLPRDGGTWVHFQPQPPAEPPQPGAVHQPAAG